MRNGRAMRERYAGRGQKARPDPITWTPSRVPYPKGTDFSQVTDDELAFVVHALNNRPRKCLGYRTPFEIVHKALSGALGS